MLDDRLQLTERWPLLTDHCLLLTAYCLLLTDYWSPFRPPSGPSTLKARNFAQRWQIKGSVWVR